MKMTTASVPFFGPRTAPARMTPSDWNVIGTPLVPMLMVPGRPSAAISAANTAAWVRSPMLSDQRLGDFGDAVMSIPEYFTRRRRSRTHRAG